MPKLHITKHEGEVLVLESPEMTQEECGAQEQEVNDNLVPHHERHVEEDSGREVRVSHKHDAKGVAGTVLDLGWIEIINDAIASCEIV